MKKVLSIILALLVLLTSVSVLAFAKSPVNLSLNSETVYAGDEFVVNLFISDNSKVSGAVIDIKYDKEMLEFISAKEGGILDSSANISIRNIDGKNSSVRFAYMSSTSEITSAGILASITFKAKETAKGDTPLEIYIESPADFVSMNIEKILFTVKNSTVKIINNVEDITDSTEPTEEISTENDILEDTTNKEENIINNSKNDIEDYAIYIVLLIVGIYKTVKHIYYSQHFHKLL